MIEGTMIRKMKPRELNNQGWQGKQSSKENKT